VRVRGAGARCGVFADIAIVGAGPAGARAAFVLARRGARVTMFDGSHPREKPCGGGVTGRALALVADAIDPSSFPNTVIRFARFSRSLSPKVGLSCQSLGSEFEVGVSCRSSGSEPNVGVPLDPGALVVADRTHFDAALLAAAERVGAILVRARVIDVSAGADGVTLTTADGATHRSAFVIGADGANSLVRRRLATPFRRDQLSIATGFFAHGVNSDEIVIELTADPPGYIWSFPRPGHLAIGICAQADAGIGAAELRARAAAWIAATRIADGATLEPYSWPIPSLSARDFDALELAGSRWALTGDAAGLVDPITREGIFFAIGSGQWIAEALDAAGAAVSYTSRVRDEAIAELSRAARLKAGFFRPAFSSLMMRALTESSAIREVMADLVAGHQSYATLKWRLLKTFELGLAWRALTSTNVERRTTNV
jgi:flavin-dependent dehydrogenase